MDLRARIKDQLLPKLVAEAKKRKASKILLVSHGLLLKELHLLLGDIATKKDNFEINDKNRSIKNTSASCYDIDVEDATDNIINVHCSLFACDEHLN